MTGVTRAPRNIAHRLIEEFMLAANEAVASHLEARGPSIYRIHEKPDPKRVMEFEEMAAHFGYSLGVGAIPVKKFGIDGPPPRRHQAAGARSWCPRRSASHRAITSSW